MAARKEEWIEKARHPALRQFKVIFSVGIIMKVRGGEVRRGEGNGVCTRGVGSVVKRGQKENAIPATAEDTKKLSLEGKNYSEWAVEVAYLCYTTKTNQHRSNVAGGGVL